MMDFQPVLFMIGAAMLLGLLGLVWKSKRGAGWPSGPRKRRMEQLDRISLTHQHAVHLLSVEGRWLAVAVTPKGVELLESGPLPGEDAEGSLPIELPMEEWASVHSRDADGKHRGRGHGGCGQ